MCEHWVGSACRFEFVVLPHVFVVHFPHARVDVSGKNYWYVGGGVPGTGGGGQIQVKGKNYWYAGVVGRADTGAVNCDVFSGVGRGSSPGGVRNRARVEGNPGIGTGRPGWAGNMVGRGRQGEVLGHTASREG